MTELSVEARALIERVGLADGPGAERRARVKRHLVAALVTTGAGIGGVAPAAAASAHAGAAGVVLGTATAAKGGLTVGSIAIWLAAGAGLGTLASAPALAVRLKAAERPAAVATPAAEAAPARPADQVAAPNAPAAALAGAPLVQPPPAPAAQLRDLARVTATAPALSEETRVLESAQRALAEGRPGAALSLLGEHERRFPNGSLVEERSAARVLSLCALGRVEEAKRAAQAFVGTAPRSPLVPRLRGSCAAPNDDPDSRSPAR